MIIIRYCGMCGGVGEAHRAQRELSRYLGQDSRLEDVGKGVFDVLDNDRIVFSKEREGRFPRSMELVKRLRTMNR